MSAPKFSTLGCRLNAYETEAMKDGSDAVSDWALLNALLNTASGATWVSFHHGGGVGRGKSIHAGQVTVADGTLLDREAAASHNITVGRFTVFLPIFAGFYDHYTHCCFP